MEDKYTPTIHYRYGQLQRENAALRAQLDEALDMILLAVDQIMDGDGLHCEQMVQYVELTRKQIEGQYGGKAERGSDDVRL